MKLRKESKMEEKKNRKDRILTDENLEEVSGGTEGDIGDRFEIFAYGGDGIKNGIAKKQYGSLFYEKKA